MAQPFRPKLLDTLKHYSRPMLLNDLIAGIIVGIVALPLAIAFAIASGVSPDRGLVTAIVAGFLISCLGGSKVQIGGPTGAFIVIVYGIVQQFGLNGLIIATFMAGFLLLIMGFLRLGSMIQFIPYPLVTGFTSAIALIIFSSQMKDLFGLQMGAVPADFINKWIAYGAHFNTINWQAFLIGSITLLILFLWPMVTHRIPGSLIAILVMTLVTMILRLPVETIGSRFGTIRSSIPAPSLPSLNFETIRRLIQPAFTIALLGAIESLLSAVVADGMIGGNHRSNIELVAQGTANIFSSIFGGIPATGAIARTATNIKNGGRTPIAGMTHAVTLFLIMIFFGKWASRIPLAVLAGILVYVAYNMSEWKNFVSLAKGPRGDTAVLLTTFFLTILVDLTVAIEIGILISAFVFMRKMIQFSGVEVLSREISESGEDPDRDDLAGIAIPKHVEVFEINGPLFFGAAYKFRDALRFVEKTPRVLIIRMKLVPIIDATGTKTIKDVYKECKRKGTKLILSEIHSTQVMEELKKARLVFAIGKANIKDSFEDALERSKVILQETKT